MKNKILILFCTVLITSCSTYVNVTNNTNESMTVLSALNKEEQADFNLTYSSLIDKNILKKGLKPNESLKVKKTKYLSLVTISENYNYHVSNDIKGTKLTIDKSNYHSSEEIVEDGAKSKIINLEIVNQSKYIINKVKLVMDRNGTIAETEDVLNFWNLIFPSQREKINYEWYGNLSFNLKTVIIIGELNGDIIEKKYTENLEELIIFN